MKPLATKRNAALAAAGAFLVLAAAPAMAAPAQSFAPMKSMSIGMKGDLEEVRHRRWHRCHWVKRCWINKWGHRRCALVRRCW